MTAREKSTGVFVEKRRRAPEDYDDWVYGFADLERLIDFYRSFSVLSRVRAKRFIEGWVFLAKLFEDNSELRLKRRERLHWPQINIRVRA